MIDTLRLILFLDCNLTCPYCCNKQEQFYSQFQYKKFDEIDFSKYKNVCVTGGEPFYKKAVLYDTFNKILSDKNIYLYTNGILITADDVVRLFGYKNLKGINIGLHTVVQIKLITPMVDYLPVRYTAEKGLVPTLLQRYPERLTRHNLKGWTLNDCNRSNEDWVMLNG